MESSNTVCAENTQKRLESQLKIIKLHKIITKVYKVICFTHTKISIPAAKTSHATQTTSAKV